MAAITPEQAGRFTEEEHNEVDRLTYIMNRHLGDNYDLESNEPVTYKFVEQAALPSRRLASRVRKRFKDVGWDVTVSPDFTEWTFTKKMS